MAKLKKAVQVCEVIFLVAGIALLCSTEGLRSSKDTGGRKQGRPDQDDDLSAWGIGA